MQLIREVKKAKARFFNQKCASCSSNFKKFWDTVKSTENKSTSSQLPTALRLGNTDTTDKSMIIENFNKHFSMVGHASWILQPRPTATHLSLPRLSLTQIQNADVLKELQNLDPCKSAGLDNLDPLFLKLSAAIVATPITSLFNLSFTSSEIPKDWKAAVVIPLFKGSDTLDPNCDRPTVYPSCPAFLKSSKAKLINRSLTISNLTPPSPLCNPVSELVTGAPQPRSRY